MGRKRGYSCMCKTEGGRTQDMLKRAPNDTEVYGG